MINAGMRLYDYYLIAENDAYGQPIIKDTAEGQVKIDINIISQGIQNNVLYENSSYVGITTDAGIDDKYVIQYGKERLKVLYVNNKGRFKQVFMARM